MMAFEAGDGVAIRTLPGCGRGQTTSPATGFWNYSAAKKRWPGKNIGRSSVRGSIEDPRGASFRGKYCWGEEGFVEKFKELLEDKKRLKEIPRAQRYVNRLSLEKIFSGQKAKAQRDISIHDAHTSHGYTLKEIADYLAIHYTTVSKVVAKEAVSKK